MKNILKKVSAFALALTLISGSTAIAKNINPKFDNAIVASAIHPVSGWTSRNGFKFSSGEIWTQDRRAIYFSQWEDCGRTENRYEVYWGIYMGRSINTCMVRKYSNKGNGWQYVTSYFYDYSSFWGSWEPLN